MLQNFFRIVGRLRWLFPIVLLAAGYNTPALRVPVSWPGTNALWAALFISLGVMAVWLVAEIVTVVHRNTGSRQLQIDAFVSFAVALAITYFAGRQGVGLEWFVVIPWTGAVLDGLLSGYLGINNAAQKPFAPHESGPYGPN
jgi:hypothetical protein